MDSSEDDDQRRMWDRLHHHGEVVPDRHLQVQLITQVLAAAGTARYRHRPTILDLGCGAGHTTDVLAALGYRVIALDQCAEAVATARRRVRWRRRRITPMVADVTRPLPIADGDVDVVHASRILHYWDDPILTATVAELGRVLRPGGILLAAVNSIWHPAYGRGTRIRPQTWSDDDGHIRRFMSRDDLERLFRPPDWVDVRITRPDPPLTRYLTVKAVRPGT